MNRDNLHRGFSRYITGVQAGTEHKGISRRKKLRILLRKNRSKPLHRKWCVTADL